MWPWSRKKPEPIPPPFRLDRAPTLEELREVVPPAQPAIWTIESDIAHTNPQPSRQSIDTDSTPEQIQEFRQWCREHGLKTKNAIAAVRHLQEMKRMKDPVAKAMHLREALKAAKDPCIPQIRLGVDSRGRPCPILPPPRTPQQTIVASMHDEIEKQIELIFDACAIECIDLAHAKWMEKLRKARADDQWRSARGAFQNIREIQSAVFDRPRAMRRLEEVLSHWWDQQCLSDGRMDEVGTFRLGLPSQD